MSTSPGGRGGPKGRLETEPRDATPSAPTDDARLALAGGARPRRFGAWYVAEHRLRVMWSYSQTILATGFGEPLIYLYALGVGLATLVDRNLGVEAAEVGYLVYVAPALLCSAGLTTATIEFSYPVLLGYKWNPTFSGMHAGPIRPRQIVDGLVISVVIRLLATMVVYFGFMLLFGAVPSPTGWLAILVATLTGLAFGTLLMAYASTIRDDTGQLAMVERLVVVPLTLFSGTFFPLSELPWFLQPIGWLSPLWHGTELSRVLTFGYAEPIWLSAVHVVVLVGMFLTGWLWSRGIAERRLTA
ncbi:ABC transporter permease [Agromyces aurantiacus]|uniref:Transport permease protein n=1 Tax=Agromyces aurantiacus TaxID=165814 RepID=A0ABV9R7V6_9MICO|nr:ABC transporter permease [Agromyces aurantiacus]MBM7504078.1 lipooligosaccharide transport system permease protein [Agromyces aurantiacus]